MKVINIFLCLFLSMLGCQCLAANDSPTVNISSDSASVAVSGQSIILNLNNASMVFKTPQGQWTIQGSFLEDTNEGWEHPSAMTGKPVIRKSADSVFLSGTFPITDKRKLTVELSAYKGIPAVFVVTRLTRLDCTRGEYYFWQSSFGYKNLIASGIDGDEQFKADTANWQSFDHKDWAFLQNGKPGGVMIMPGSKFGRGPGSDSGIYFLATPSSYNVSPGGYHNCSFGLSYVADASQARRIYNKAQKRKIPALGFIPGIEKPVYGTKAPKWLREAENYTLYYQPSATWTDELFNNKLKYYPLIVGSTPDKKALDMCHKAGIKLLVYVNYMELVDTEKLIKAGRDVYYEWAESIDHDSRDLKNHQDWVCIDDKGNPMRSAFAVNTSNPGLFETCLHQKGLHEAAIHQIKMIMEAGYDGVFIDNSMSVPECYGGKFGIHQHVAGKTNTQMYEQLQKEIYATIKSYGNDRIVIQNGMLPNHWTYTDSWMAESMPFNSGKMSNDWSELKWIGIEHSGAERNGKVPVILPYLSEMPTDKLKDSALFSMAYGRLYGFLWTDCMALLDRPETIKFGQELCSMKLGSPLEQVKQSGKALYRQFRNGFAILNPTKSPVTVSIPVKIGKSYRNAGFDEILQVKSGKVTITIPPESGRALLRIL